MYHGIVVAAQMLRTHRRTHRPTDGHRESKHEKGRGQSPFRRYVCLSVCLSKTQSRPSVCSSSYGVGGGGAAPSNVNDRMPASVSLTCAKFNSGVALPGQRHGIDLGRQCSQSQGTPCKVQQGRDRETADKALDFHPDTWSQIDT